MDANGVSLDSDGDGIPDCNDTCDNTVDTDGDGISDCDDQEPDSACPDAVDANGVSLDSDGDGIPDCNDTCDNTVDTDGDGISDCDDQEPNSACPDAVDANGVSLDSDGDGIPDCNDTCDNTVDTDGDGISDCDDQEPNSACPDAVDANGVSLDSDGDGIPDCNDNCSDTPNADQADLDNDGIGDVCDDKNEIVLKETTVDCEKGDRFIAQYCYPVSDGSRWFRIKVNPESFTWCRDQQNDNANCSGKDPEWNSISVSSLDYNGTTIYPPANGGITTPNFDISIKGVKYQVYIVYENIESAPPIIKNVYMIQI